MDHIKINGMQIVISQMPLGGIIHANVVVNDNSTTVGTENPLTEWRWRRIGYTDEHSCVE